MNLSSLFLALFLFQNTLCAVSGLEDTFDDSRRSLASFQRQLQPSNGCNEILQQLPNGCTCGSSNEEGTFFAICNRFCQRCLATRQICVTYSLKFEYRLNTRLSYIPRAIEYQAFYTGRDSANVEFSYRINYDTSFTAQSCTSSIDGTGCICEVDNNLSCFGELKHNCVRNGGTAEVFETCKEPGQVALSSPFAALTFAELRIENCGSDSIPPPSIGIPPKKSFPERNKDTFKLSNPADGGRGSLARKLRSRGSRG